MQKPLPLGLVAISAILTSGLAFAQGLENAAAEDQSAPQQADGVKAADAVKPVDDKPLQTPEEKAEQDRRVLGVLPNYRTADGTKKFVPLSAKQKIRIASKDSFDYPSYILAGGLSLIYQAENQNPSFGQGVAGYLHRYGTSVGDQVIGNMLSEGFMPALLHQDPRYFRKVHGSFLSRLGYSATRTLICKDDKGRTTFNASEILGNGIGAAIGASYYPDGRSYSDTFSRMYTSIATDTISNILKEFWPDIRRKYSHRRSAKDSVTP